MSEDHVTRAISVAIRQVLERYRSVDYDIKINALIANLTDIVARSPNARRTRALRRILRKGHWKRRKSRKRRLRRNHS